MVGHILIGHAIVPTTIRLQQLLETKCFACFCYTPKIPNPIEGVVFDARKSLPNSHTFWAYTCELIVTCISIDKIIIEWRTIFVVNHTVISHTNRAKFEQCLKFPLCIR